MIPRQFPLLPRRSVASFVLGAHLIFWALELQLFPREKMMSLSLVVFESFGMPWLVLMQLSGAGLLVGAWVAAVRGVATFVGAMVIGATLLAVVADGRWHEWPLATTSLAILLAAAVLLALEAARGRLM